MAAKRTIVSIAAAAVIALAAVIFISNSPASEPRTALAGPCAGDPELFFSIEPLQMIRLAGGTPGGGYTDSMDVETNPSELPSGKMVKITVVAINGHPGISNAFTPAQSDGSFTTQFLTVIGSTVPPGVYDYEVQIDCHITDEDTNVTKIPYKIYVDMCPADASSGFQISGNGTPTPGPRPDTCEEPSPTPSPPPATPTPSPTPTPTAAPGQQVTWADNNCKDGVNPVDSLLVLRGDAGLSANTNECPPMGANINVLLASLHIWGDVDCKDGMSPVDSLKILRFDAGLSVSQEEGCPGMGSAVTIVEL